MPIGVVKTLVGFSLVGLHLTSIFLCYYWLDSRLESQNFRIIILILSPVSAVYALAFVKDAVRFMNAGQRPASFQTTVTFASLAIIFTSAFGVLLIYTIFQFSNSPSGTPDDLKDRLALIEVMVGGFMGLIIDELFGKVTPPNAP